MIAEYQSSIDIEVQGLEAQQSILNLAKGSISTTYQLPASDYSIDILPTDNQTLLAENLFISLAANDDVTVFFYLNEVEVEVDDAPDEIEVYVNSLPVDNSNRVSLYDHQVNIINLVQDDRFDQIKVYFVRSNETVSTADYATTTSLASPKTITVPNNTYSVNLISTVDDSDLLLHYQEITLTDEDGDYFLVLEKDPTSNTGFSAQFISQSN